MKYIIYGISLASVVMITLAVIMTVSGRNVRGNGIRQALEAAAVQAVNESGTAREEPSAEEESAFQAIFLEQLLSKVESDGTVKISVDMSDRTKGIISARTEEEFLHPNGKTGTVRAEKMVIREQYRLPGKNAYTITYLVGEERYKQYILQEGSRLPVPAPPEGGFRYWLDENGVQQNLESLSVSGDKTFYAVMEES